MVSGGATSITGGSILLNGGCLPVARLTDHVDNHDLIDTASATVRSC